MNGCFLCAFEREGLSSCFPDTIDDNLYFLGLRTIMIAFYLILLLTMDDVQPVFGDNPSMQFEINVLDV